MSDANPTYGPADWTPDHYRGDGLQPFDVINAFGLDFYEGNALKYLLRWQKKNGVEDLRKARTYVQVLIDRAEREANSTVTPSAPEAKTAPMSPLHILGAGADSEEGRVDARRTALQLLLARLERGAMLADEKALLRQHVEVEIREADTARSVAAGNKRHVQVMYAELTAAQAAIKRVRVLLAGRWGSVDPELVRAALDATEQPEADQEQGAPVDWQAIVRDRERELKTVGERKALVEQHRDQLAATLGEANYVMDMQKEFIRGLRSIVMTATACRQDEGVSVERCARCGQDHMAELYKAVLATDKAYAEAFPATADGPARPGRLPDDAPRTPRQRAYEAVNAYIESLGDRLPTTRSARTAHIWLAVNRALEAAGHTAAPETLCRLPHEMEA